MCESALEREYNKVVEKYDLRIDNRKEKISGVIRCKLKGFIDCCDEPAIWCFGKHTEMLMADYIFELRRVRYIIDKKTYDKEGGFCIISSDEIDGNHIDGIVISSYVYREEIRKQILEKHPNIKYFDIYEELEKEGIILFRDYYCGCHPYDIYLAINGLIMDIEKKYSYCNAWKLMKILISIKAIDLARTWAMRFFDLSSSDVWTQIAGDLEELFGFQLEAADNVSENNVVMLCFDGLRNRDLEDGFMPKLRRYLTDKTEYYDNAYSVSTSTFESLIPAYGENDDLRTEYYKKDMVDSEGCRMINYALMQNRKIFFYTDSCKFIDNADISVTDHSQTFSEKIWDFLIDSANEENGLFYIHELYESHFSYPNPYTNVPLIADGSSIVFDFLDRNGRKLRCDYRKQQLDSLKYLDDMITPFLDRLRCKAVIYADHGNLILSDGMDFSSTDKVMNSFGQDLIRIPLAVKSGFEKKDIRSQLMSLMEINSIVISLLKGEKYIPPDKEFIKVVRSEIYNPDLRYLYSEYGFGNIVNAFEVFIFREGYKLVIFDNQVIELYSIDDILIDDEETKKRFFERIKNRITVFNMALK